MKGKIRNMFPGGNTPSGFYSYYDYVIDRNDADRVFCLKGGPGTGKSTLMKEISMYFAEQGENIELMWCSSDPGSLDCVVLKDKRIAVIDGTSPHIVDPEVPGAVDEIINLGDCWDEDELKKRRRQIIECRRSIKQAYQIAYMYLSGAGNRYDMMSELLDDMISQEAVRELKYQLNMKIDGVAMIRRAENKIVRSMAVGSSAPAGKCRRLFAGAVTSDGIKNELLSVTGNARKIIALKVPEGFRTERILNPVSQRLREASFDIEEYYCPMDPEKKLEHIVCPEIGLAVVTCNQYHDISADTADRKIMNIELDISEERKSMYGEVYEHICCAAKEDIDYALRYFAFAKEFHDELESCYIPNMDFQRLDEIKKQIVDKIEGVTC